MKLEGEGTPEETVWLTTAPSPTAPGYAEPRGWRLHAVRGKDSETLVDLRHRTALCGLRAAHGWGLDLFIERWCARCLVALGVACDACRGVGGSCRVCLGRQKKPGETK